MLDEAERARIAQMRKVQGMLAKVQKKGYLYKLEKSAVLGTSKWKKRYSRASRSLARSHGSSLSPRACGLWRWVVGVGVGVGVGDR
jgi:hypothetical protein